MTSDTFTTQLTDKTISFVSGQYFDLQKPFAFPRQGNNCTFFSSGRDYLGAVARAIRGAQSFVMITDWQLDYDVELDRRGEAGHPGRLTEILADAIQRGVHIRVILYDSIGAALDTHDEATQNKLRFLPPGRGSIDVLVENPNTGRPLISFESGVLFSHHQKSVVVDGQVAFVGGLDLAYGRWDTHAFNVVIDPQLRIINDAYNQQLDAARPLADREFALTKRTGHRPPFQSSLQEKGRVFDERYQPRQPWQDVALAVQGSAAFDVFVNFILRWNSFARSGTNVFDRAVDTRWFMRAKGHEYLVDPLAKGAGSCTVQICRSASSKQLRDELILWDDKHEYVHDDWRKANPGRRRIVEVARASWVDDHQTSIYDAMINCIRSAQAFIYIENQFFMSNCGVDERGSPAPSKNSIVSELANAIGRAIHAERPFHVWLILPEHPEGKLEEEGTKSQAWWALQGVKRARDSLINRVNAILFSKNAAAWGVSGRSVTNESVLSSLKSRGYENEWQSYLTVLNLRNFGLTSTHAMTEMIYVHSKLLIVDDAVAIVGSANINDRSLLGNGDTELAAVIVDNADAKLTDVGAGVSVVTRKFARELRLTLWRKHLGMLVDESTTGAVKQDRPPNGIDPDKPLAVQTIRGLQKLAAFNRSIYSDVFVHTPRDSYGLLVQGRALAFPPIKGNPSVRDFAVAPALQREYMIGNTHNTPKASQRLSAITGFFVEMPLEWGFQEPMTPRAPKGLSAAIASNNEVSANMEV